MAPISNQDNNGLKAFMLTLLVVGGVLLFLWWKSDQASSPQPPPAQAPQTKSDSLPPSSPGLGLDARIAALNQSLQQDVPAKVTAHQGLGKELLSMSTTDWDAAGPVLEKWKQAPLPGDYQFFVQKILPRFQQQAPATGRFWEGQNMLFSFPPGQPYQAHLYFNENKLSPSDLEQQLVPPDRKQRWVVSGAYTSPQNWPVGLSMVEGQLLNPALQAFDGLLLISPGGQVQIEAVDSLPFWGRTFQLASRKQDFLDFLRLARQEKLSLLQSHLLLQAGQLMTRPKPNAPRFRRRVLFRTRDGGLHLFDSFAEKLSLHQTARRLQETYQAWQAFNLDMGTFNFALEYGPGYSRNFGDAQNNIPLTNLLIFDF